MRGEFNERFLVLFIGKMQSLTEWKVRTLGVCIFRALHTVGHSLEKQTEVPTGSSN